MAHVKTTRPWGYYEVLDIGIGFKVKRLAVATSHQLSLQKHHHRSERWIVVRGTAAVTLDGKVTHYPEGSTITIPQGAIHRLSNPGRMTLEVIEVQFGNYLEEDDIERLDK